MTDREELYKLKADFLELKVELDKLAKVCDNLKEEIQKSNGTGSVTGIYLEGVPDIYKDELVKELASIQKR